MFDGREEVRPVERIAIFIDGPNLTYTMQQLGWDIDFGKLLRYFSRGGRLLRAFYYASRREGEFDPMLSFLDYLDYNGYTVVTKPQKRYYNPATGQYEIKGNMDIELAIDMLLLADHIDRAVLFSGDGDFRRLVEAVQMKGVRVVVVSTIRTLSPMIADELRRQADEFVDLADEEVKREIIRA
jgi:uncharacterized LabA/DUF88 family protein